MAEQRLDVPQVSSSDSEHNRFYRFSLDRESLAQGQPC
jgi:hypothetical protein